MHNPNPRIGLVGVGRWGRFILRDLKTLGAEVWAVTPSADNQANATAGGADHLRTSVAELPADLDGYVVATPEQTHLDIVDQLLPRGRPIYVEKPLDVDVARAHALPPAAQSLVFVMHKWRYHHGVLALAALARSGELGAVQGLECLRVQYDAPKRLVDTVWVHTPHDLSIALTILGEVPRAEAAMVHPLAPEGHGIVALLRTGSGVGVLIQNTIGAVRTERKITLTCAVGTACLANALDDHILIQRPGAALERRPIATGMPLLAELEAFLDHLQGGPPPMSCLADELLILDALTAMRRLAGLDRTQE